MSDGGRLGSGEILIWKHWMVCVLCGEVVVYVLTFSVFWDWLSKKGIAPK